MTNAPLMIKRSFVTSGCHSTTHFALTHFAFWHLKSTGIFYILFLLIVFSTLIAYWPGLSGSFLLDDFANLDALGKFGGVRNWETFQLYAFSTISGPGGRPLSMISFLLNDNTWPSDSFSFKYTNLLLHLLTGILLNWLIYRLMLSCDSRQSDNRAASIALLTAALWLLHPFNVSTTLYVVQRMTILSALFSILGLLLYVKGRESLVNQPRQAYLWMTLSVILCTPLAFFSKENGALLPLLILVLEYTALRYPGSPKPSPRWILVFLGLPNLLIAGYFATHWDVVMESYGLRPFTMAERLLTESRIVWQYFYYLVIPKTSSSGLFNENLELSRGLFDPPITLIAVSAIFTAVLIAWWARTRFQLLSLAILFFLAGHLLESTFIALELYFEHRNYLPSIFLFLPLTRWLIDSSEKQKWLKLIAPLFVGLFFSLTYQQAVLWGNSQQLTRYWAQKNPYSIRAQQALANDLESRGQPQLALEHLEKTLKVFPDHVELWLHRIIILCDYSTVDPVEFSKLEKLSKTGFYDFRTYPLLEMLINALTDGRCSGANTTDAHRLLDALLQNKTAQTTEGPKRQIYHLHGLVYLREEQATLALHSFRNSQYYWPDVEVGLLQVSLLAENSMFTEAVKLLKIIRENFQSNKKKLSYQQKINFVNEMVQLEKLLVVDQEKTNNPRDQ